MAQAVFQPSDRLRYESLVKTAFTPHSPVNNLDLFAGRIEQIRSMTDTVTTPGLHAVLCGERGVGKTSLTNILKDILADVLAVSRVNCSQRDDFDSVMRRSVGALTFGQLRPAIGFRDASESTTVNLTEYLSDGPLSPDAIATILDQLPPFVVLVVDEFDRLSADATHAFADLMKSLSDRGSDATLVLVGVASDVDELIASHVSIERCLRQIRMPRMSDEELRQIVDKGLAKAEMTVEAEIVTEKILSFSQGFPHYTHLLAQNAARAALDRGSLGISMDDLTTGLEVAVDRADQTHRDLYHKAVTGTKKDNLWRHVVLACAMAERDERGFFSSRAVQDAMSELLQRNVSQQSIAFHLGKLIEPSRGPLLERIGPERRYRYGFVNSLVRPFILIKAEADGMLPD
jgi:Cdc6-like AAA superfamily ATPase